MNNTDDLVTMASESRGDILEANIHVAPEVNVFKAENVDIAVCSVWGCVAEEQSGGPH